MSNKTQFTDEDYNYFLKEIKKYIGTNLTSMKSIPINDEANTLRSHQFDVDGTLWFIEILPERHLVGFTGGYSYAPAVELRIVTPTVDDFEVFDFDYDLDPLVSYGVTLFKNYRRASQPFDNKGQSMDVFLNLVKDELKHTTP